MGRERGFEIHEREAVGGVAEFKTKFRIYMPLPVAPILAWGMGIYGARQKNRQSSKRVRENQIIGFLTDMNPKGHKSILKKSENKLSSNLGFEG